MFNNEEIKNQGLRILSRYVYTTINLGLNCPCRTTVHQPCTKLLNIHMFALRESILLFMREYNTFQFLNLLLSNVHTREQSCHECIQIIQCCSHIIKSLVLMRDFCNCSMAAIERQTLYSSWDNICTSYNVKQGRLPDGQNSDFLILNWNGVITSADWAIWHQKFNTSQSMRSIYVGNCYKNSTWN